MPKARKGGEHEWVIIPPYRKGSPPMFFLSLSVSMVVFMGFNAFGTRLHSLWNMFFFCQKDFPCDKRNRMQDKILFFTFFVSMIL